MNDQTIKLALAHAQIREFRQRLRRTYAILEDAFSINLKWYIALSGGKDSTVVLHLIRQNIQPDIVAATSIQEWCFPETKAYLESVPNLWRVASGSDHGTGWSPNWESEDSIPENVLWVGAKQEGKDHTIKNYGRDEAGAFLGLRADESSSRRTHIRTCGSLFFSKKNQVWQCSPIAHWSVKDVWAYLLSNHVPYNAAYDRMDSLGVPLHQQRIGPFAVDKVLGYGQLAILKRGWPDLFNRYAARHPEARQFI